MKKIHGLLMPVYTVFGLFVPESVAICTQDCFKQSYGDKINQYDIAFSRRVKLKEERSLAI